MFKHLRCFSMQSSRALHRPQHANYATRTPRRRLCIPYSGVPQTAIKGIMSPKTRAAARKMSETNAGRIWPLASKTLSGNAGTKKQRAGDNGNPAKTAKAAAGRSTRDQRQHSGRVFICKMHTLHVRAKMAA